MLKRHRKREMRQKRLDVSERVARPVNQTSSSKGILLFVSSFSIVEPFCVSVESVLYWIVVPSFLSLNFYLHENFTREDSSVLDDTEL